MRASPAFQFTLNRIGVWRLGVSALAALALAVLLAWLATRAEPLPSLALLAWAGTFLAVPLVAGSLLRMPAVTLRWDGRQWWLVRTASAMGPAAVEVNATPGDIEVALDLGGWMLLRFQAHLPPQPPPQPQSRPWSQPRRLLALTDARSTWLPVQRRGLESHWHALRCAVYSPRPAPVRDAAEPS